MANTSMSRIVALIVAVLFAGGVALTFAIQYIHRESPVETKAAATAPAISKSASEAPAQSQATLPAAQAAINALTNTLVGSPKPPVCDSGVSAFDIARIEPAGEAVIVGRGAPSATVELLRNGEVYDRTVADQYGQFAMVPPPLPQALTS